jgi:phospholipid/cholesterol/gamma-HCH transport system ATP-binding protein
MTVYENVIIGLYEHGERDMDLLNSEARRVLSAVGLLPDISENGTMHFEKEFSLLSAKKPSDLSGGMKKRVGVARALVGSPSYIFYDEPTTGLDPVNSEQIDKMILELSKKLSITSLVITHDMFSVFNIADHVAMLDNGKVCFEGDAHTLQITEDPIVSEFISRFQSDARMQ